MSQGNKPGTLKQSRASIETVRASKAPTQQQIRERAFLIYESRSGVHGCPETNWFEAESNLLANAGMSSKPTE